MPAAAALEEPAAAAEEEPEAGARAPEPVARRPAARAERAQEGPAEPVPEEAEQVRELEEPVPQVHPPLVLLVTVERVTAEWELPEHPQQVHRDMGQPAMERFLKATMPPFQPGIGRSPTEAIPAATPPAFTTVP